MSADLQDIQALIKAAQQGQVRFTELQQAREGASPEAQKQLGPLEHRAFTRELVQENAAMAIPMALATPAYTAGKTIARTPPMPGAQGLPYNILQQLAKSQGLHKTRSPASVEEVMQGYMGILEGLASKFSGGAAEGGIPKDKKGKPKNTQFDLSNPDDVERMLKAISPKYNTPTRQLGDGTPYGPEAYAKMVRNQPELGGRGDPKLRRSRAEQVTEERKQAGLPSPEQILQLIYESNPKLAKTQKRK